MSRADELLRLAREREANVERTLGEMLLEPPERLGRQMRDYLSRQVDHGRMKRTDEKLPHLATVQGGINQLSCPRAEFSSGARLHFDIQLQHEQRGWIVKRFRFLVHLAQPRSMSMIQIHLNAETSHDPLAVPRCHMHIGDSEAHLPFPVMHPRLILHLLCELIEPDVGI